MVAVAAIGASVIGAGASIISGNKASSAQKDAAKQSSEIDRYIYDTTRKDLQPSRIVGESALYQLADLYGVQRPTSLQSTGSAAPTALERRYGAFGGGYNALGGNYASPGQIDVTEAGGGFKTSPGYQFRLNEGLNALQSSAAARGKLLSGQTLKGITDYAQGRASDEFGNYTRALMSLAGVGQAANQNQQQAGQQFAAGTTNALQQAGNARASSYANIGSSVNTGINNALTTYLYDKNGLLSTPSAISGSVPAIQAGYSPGTGIF